MRKTFAAVPLVLLAATLGAQDHGHMHGGAAIEQNTRLTVSKTDDWLTLDYGPIVLPAHTSHHEPTQPPTLAIELPADGWLSATPSSCSTARDTRCRDACCIM
jgi:hypothetical protein